MKNLNKTEKAVGGLIVAVILFFLLQIIRWFVKR